MFKSEEEYKNNILKLRKERQLHPKTEEVLFNLIHDRFPDAFIIRESSTVSLGHRADIKIHLPKNKIIHFEIFATHDNVSRDINSLCNSIADFRIALLLDEYVDKKIADSYFHELDSRSLSHDYFIKFKLSDVLINNKQEGFIGKLIKELKNEEMIKRAPGIMAPALHNQTPPEPNFVGRTEILETITEWYKSPEVRVGALIGWGGVGKSALVRKWYDSLEENNIHPDGIFWWGFYRNTSLDQFLNALLRFVSQGQIDPASIKSTWEKVDKIKIYLQEAEYLIILDGLEEMQKGEASGEEFGSMEHKECTELLKYFADANPPSPPFSKGGIKGGLCLITTRYPLTDIKNYESSSYQNLEVESLSLEDARELFKKVGVKVHPYPCHSEAIAEESQFDDYKEIDSVINEYNGHALSLTLLANYLVQDFHGDIKKSKEIPPFHSDKEAGGKAHRMLLWYDKQLKEEQRAFMKIFSLFRTAVTEKDFEGVFHHPIPPFSKGGEGGIKHFNQCLIDMTPFSFKRMVDNLCDRRLITKSQQSFSPLAGESPSEGSSSQRDSEFDIRNSELIYTTHPLIKNYFISIFDEESKKLCHKINYQYIGTYAPEQPKTLEEMQPLFEQVYHGCMAGFYDDVYRDIYIKKFMRLDEQYLIYDLGAWETDLVILKNFFPKQSLSEMPKLTVRETQGSIINSAGLALLNIGKPYEAVRLLKMAIDLAIEDKEWKNASTGYRNLSDLQFRIGKIKEAEESAKNALLNSKQANNLIEQSITKSYLGYTLFLQGNIEKAEIFFKEADIIYKNFYPNIGGLFGMYGFFYSDFLAKLGNLEQSFVINTRTLTLYKNTPRPLAVSYSYLSLASLERININYDKSNEHINKSLEIAKKIGMPEIEIQSLIERGRLRIDTKDYAGAESDLKDALKLVERTCFRFYKPDAEVVLGKVYLALGDINKAKSYANSAYQKAEQMHYHWAQLDAENLLKEIENKANIKS